MKPYYEEAGITIYHGDCREVLPGIRGSAVVTDPPYGLGFEGHDWDRAIPDWLPAARVAAETVIFTTAPTTVWDYPRPDWMLAYSRQGATTRTAQGGFCHWTPILLYGPAHFAVDFMRSNDKAAHLESWANSHPCPKPGPIVRWMICGTSRADEIVIDPFMGSGTTLRAAKDLGRRAIGIEIEERYCEIAARRLSQSVLDFGDNHEAPTRQTESSRTMEAMGGRESAESGQDLLDLPESEIAANRLRQGVLDLA